MSESEQPSAVLDSNVYISALLTNGPPREIIRGWRSERFNVLVSMDQKQELNEVLIRPKLVGTFTFVDFTADDMLAALATDARLVQPVEELPLHSRDIKDDPILATALGRLRIVSPAEFLKTLALS